MINDPEALASIILLLILIIIYFIPYLIAKIRGHHNSKSIFILNLFLGCTFIGWVASLAWAFTKVDTGL